jgi:aminopeptidase N
LPFAFTHLTLELQVQIDEKQVTGSATLDFERVSHDATTLILDAIAFEIHQVEIEDGKGVKAAQFSYDGEQIEISIPRRTKAGRVRIGYTAEPRSGLYFLAPDAQVKDRPLQVWSQCQDEEARHWFPCHDKPHVKMTAEFKITVPSRFSVLCNGELLSETKSVDKNRASSAKRRTSSLTTFHYKLDKKLPSYLVTLVVGEFDRISDRTAKLASGREIPVSYWVPKGQIGDGKRAFDRTPEMIELFSQLTGVEYPYSRYTQVVVSDFIFGGMENTTATTMYEHILLDQRAAQDIESHSLVAHELAHQWFGDWVTCRDWPHAWLNEGFATYFEQVEREHRLGRDEYLLGVESDVAAYLAEAGGRYSRPVVCHDYAEPIDLFDRHLYEKGALILHLLRNELGDKVFWSAVQGYLNRHGAEHVTTTDLRNALEQASGSSLERFFDEWLLQPGHPVVQVRGSYSDGQLSVRFEQTQDRSPFALQFEIEVMDAGGQVQIHRVAGDTKHTTLCVPLSRRPKYVGVDPNLLLVGGVHLHLPADWLLFQLQSGSSARLRRQAAVLLGAKPDFRAVKALREVLLDAKQNWSVRAAAAGALGKLRTDDAWQALSLSLKIPHPKVLTAVVEAVGEFRRPSVYEALRPLMNGKHSYLVEAAATRALGGSGAPNASEPLRKALNTRSWAEVVASAAVDAIADETRVSGKTDDAVELLKQYTAYGKATRLRRRAVLALGRIGTGAAIREHLEHLLDDPHPHFREDVASALRTLGDKRARGALNRRAAVEPDGRVLRRLKEAAQSFDDHKDARLVKEKLETLERELNELRGKVSELAARTSKKKARRAQS